MSTPQPGWYPDPSPGAPPSSLRWWDGAQWTGHARAGGAATATVPVRQRPTTADGQPLAGWWWRVLALVVDTVVVGVVNILVTLPWQIEMQREQQARQRDLQERIARGEPFSFTDLWDPMADFYGDHVLMLVVLPIVLAAAYQGGMLRRRGATLGKLVCGLRVRPRAADGRLSRGTIAARVGVQLGPGWSVLVLTAATGSTTVFVVGQLLSSLFFAVDSLTALGARRQTLHDRAARTVVVTTR
jgi:uncharacterized RDD family membrane protein YckC